MAKEIEPVASLIDKEEEFPMDNFKKMAELELTGLLIPKKYGGSEGDAILLSIAAEEIARACAATCAIFRYSPTFMHQTYISV